MWTCFFCVAILMMANLGYSHDVLYLSLAIQARLVPRVVIQSCVHLAMPLNLLMGIIQWQLWTQPIWQCIPWLVVGPGFMMNKQLLVLFGQQWQNYQNLDGVFLCWSMSPTHGRRFFLYLIISYIYIYRSTHT